MALKNYTTTKSAIETAAEINMMLAKHGAKKVMFDYDDDGRITSIMFSIVTPDGEQAIKLPANVLRVQHVLKSQKTDPKVKNRSSIDDSYAQAERVAWRIVRDWLDAQLAILETEMVDMRQVFLPYFVNRAGVTLYEAYCDGSLLLPGDVT